MHGILLTVEVGRFFVLCTIVFTVEVGHFIVLCTIVLTVEVGHFFVLCTIILTVEVGHFIVFHFQLWKVVISVINIYYMCTGKYFQYTIFIMSIQLPVLLSPQLAFCPSVPQP